MRDDDGVLCNESRIDSVAYAAADLAKIDRRGCKANKVKPGRFGSCRKSLRFVSYRINVCRKRYNNKQDINKRVECEGSTSKKGGDRRVKSEGSKRQTK